MGGGPFSCLGLRVRSVVFVQIRKRHCQKVAIVQVPHPSGCAPEPWLPGIRCGGGGRVSGSQTPTSPPTARRDGGHTAADERRAAAAAAARLLRPLPHPAAQVQARQLPQLPGLQARAARLGVLRAPRVSPRPAPAPPALAWRLAGHCPGDEGRSARPQLARKRSLRGPAGWAPWRNGQAQLLPRGSLGPAS